MLRAMNTEAHPVPERLRAWLGRAVEQGASDLHLIAGYSPVLRQHGELIELPEPPLTGAETHALLSALCPAEALPRLETQKNVDFSFELSDADRTNRFRTNLFHAGGQLGACVRVVPTAIPDF